MLSQLEPDAEFTSICRQIAAENKTADEWAEIEADDMFQTDRYEGGYDADEQAFCFSYWTPDGEEYWFQLALEDVAAIAAGERRSIELRPAGG